MNEMERTDQRKALDEFANAGAQPNQPRGHALVRPTSGVAERVIGAQPVAVYRDEARILQKLAALAAAAGSDWFYRFPVKNKDGSQGWIEGCSIKLTNDVARIFGNCAVEVREIDVGDAWTFYARFTDIETGFSMERAYRQRKSQVSLKTKDADRQQDIAYQIGQSKAIRNVISNGLQIYCDYAFDHARNSLVDKIGKDLSGWRERTVQGLTKIPVELARAERVVGRASKDWLAPDIAQVIAMMRSIADGMASADETFPPMEQPKEEVASSAVQTPSGEANKEAAAGADQHVDDKSRRPSDPDDEQQQEAPDDIAYHRGVEARAAGSTAKALPGEYRDQTRTREALAWRAGFDGQPKPEHSQEK